MRVGVSVIPNFSTCWTVSFSLAPTWAYGRCNPVIRIRGTGSRCFSTRHFEHGPVKSRRGKFGGRGWVALLGSTMECGLGTQQSDPGLSRLKSPRPYPVGKLRVDFCLAGRMGDFGQTGRKIGDCTVFSILLSLANHTGDWCGR